MVILLVSCRRTLTPASAAAAFFRRQTHVAKQSGSTSARRGGGPLIYCRGGTVSLRNKKPKRQKEGLPRVGRSRPHDDGPKSNFGFRNLRKTCKRMAEPRGLRPSARPPVGLGLEAGVRAAFGRIGGEDGCKKAISLGSKLHGGGGGGGSHGGALSCDT